MNLASGGVSTAKRAYPRNHLASSYTYCSLTAIVCIAFGSNTYTILRCKDKGDEKWGPTSRMTTCPTYPESTVKDGDGPILLKLPVKGPALLVVQLLEVSLSPSQGNVRVDS